MPGSIVGVDGSAHARRALERAVREAAIHHAPLTVITVHQAVRGYFSGPANYPEDQPLTEKAREAAQAETDQVLSEVGEPRPESVTVTAVHGFPAEGLVKAGSDADKLVVGSRGAGGFARPLVGAGTLHGAPHPHSPGPLVPPPRRDRGGQRPPAR